METKDKVGCGVILALFILVGAMLAHHAITYEKPAGEIIDQVEVIDIYGDTVLIKGTELTYFYKR